MKEVPIVESEFHRNVRWTGLYKQILSRKWPGCRVMVSHHIFVEKQDATVQEIPSADTILFDPSIMGAVFGSRAPARMSKLARMRPVDREKQVQRWLLGVR